MKMKLTDLIRKRGGLTRIFLDTPKYNGSPNIKTYMRQVRVMKNDLQSYVPGKGYTMVEDYVGKFHAWGTELWEQQEGSITYSVAIVEKDDGSIALVAPQLIVFIN